MSNNTPRGFQFVLAAIADLEDLGDFAKLREFAREQWGDDPRHAELEALLDQRAEAIAARGAQAELFDPESDRDAG